MRDREIVLLILATCGLILFFSVKWLPDPYLHQEKVTTFAWITREIDEIFTGERE